MGALWRSQVLSEWRGKSPKMPKAGFQKGKRKDGTEENFKKWALSSNLQLLSGKRQNHKFLKEIKSNLSPHKHSFTVKGKKILLYGKCKLLPNFRLKTWQRDFGLPVFLSWRCLSSGWRYWDGPGFQVCFSFRIRFPSDSLQTRASQKASGGTALI